MGGQQHNDRLPAYTQKVNQGMDSGHLPDSNDSESVIKHCMVSDRCICH